MQYQYSRVYTPTKVVNNQGHCTAYHMVLARVCIVVSSSTKSNALGGWLTTSLERKRYVCGLLTSFQSINSS